jgi:hypothetical protein
MHICRISAVKFNFQAVVSAHFDFYYGSGAFYSLFWRTFKNRLPEELPCYNVLSKKMALLNKPQFL